MYTNVQILFNDVRDVLASPVQTPSMRRSSTNILRPSMYLPLSQGQMVQSREDVRRSVVDLARRIMISWRIRSIIKGSRLDTCLRDELL
jgi:hypothetical protein